jgi:hypothetical protein
MWAEVEGIGGSTRLDGVIRDRGRCGKGAKLRLNREGSGGRKSGRGG